MRHAEAETRVCVYTPSPGHAKDPKVLRFRRERKLSGRCQEPASTGTRSREFGKQISDERIVGCLSGEVSKGAASREVPSPKEAVSRLVILTTGFGRETAKTVRWSSALINSDFREKVGLEGIRALVGRGS